MLVATLLWQIFPGHSSTMITSPQRGRIEISCCSGNFGFTFAVRSVFSIKDLPYISQEHGTKEMAIVCDVLQVTWNTLNNSLKKDIQLLLLEFY